MQGCLQDWGKAPGPLRGVSRRRICNTQRLPTLDEIYSNDFAPPAAPNFSLGLGKEKSNNYEAGFAVSLGDVFVPADSFDIKTTGFYNRISDLITRQRNQYPQYINLADAEIYGVEVEAAYSSDRFFADAGFAYVIGNDITNKTSLNTVAPVEFTLGLGARMPEHNLTFGWDGRFVAAQNRVSSLRNSREASEAFSAHDFYVSWKPDEDSQFHGWEGSFRIENAFNAQYNEFLSNDDAKGRTFKLTAVKAFTY